MRIFFFFLLPGLRKRKKYWHHTKRKAAPKLCWCNHCCRAAVGEICGFTLILRVGKNPGVPLELARLKCRINIEASWLDGLVGCRGFYSSSRSMAVEKCNFNGRHAHMTTTFIAVVACVRICACVCVCVYSGQSNWIPNYGVTFETFMSCHQCANPYVWTQTPRESTV